MDQKFNEQCCVEYLQVTLSPRLGLAEINILNLNLNSLLVKRQIDNPSPGAVTGGN